MTAARRDGAAKFEKTPARVKKRYQLQQYLYIQILLGSKMPWPGHIPYPRPVGHARRHMSLTGARRGPAGAHGAAPSMARCADCRGVVWAPPRRAQSATDGEKTQRLADLFVEYDGLVASGLLRQLALERSCYVWQIAAAVVADRPLLSRRATLLG